MICYFHSMGAIKNAWLRITGRGGEEAKAFDAAAAVDTVIGSLVGSTSATRDRGAGAMLKSYNSSPWVRKAIGQIAIDFAAVRWTTYTVKGNRAQRQHVDAMMKRAKCADRVHLKRTLLGAGVLEENPTHPAVLFLEAGNPWHSGVGARRLLSTYLRLLGNAYAVIERGNSGLPMSYLPIPSTWIEEMPTEKSPFFKVSHGSWRQKIPPADMLWVRDSNPADPYGSGVGVVSVLGDEIETDEYAARTAKAKFENFGTPSSIVGVEGASKESGERLQQKWDEDHRGIRKIGRPYFTGAKITVAKLDDDLNQSQFIPLREFERDTILQTIGVPPEVIGIMDSANKASAQVARQTYTENTLVPDLELFRSMMQVQLMTQYRDGSILDYDSPIEEDEERRIDLLKVAPEWALTRNQWLDAVGLDPVDGGNVYFVPANLVPVESKAVAPHLIRALAKHNAATSPAIDSAAARIAGLLAPSTEAHREPEAPALRVLSTVKEITPDDVDRVLEHLRPERLINQYEPEITELVDEWGNIQLVEVGLQANTFDMLSPLVVEHLEEFSGTRIEWINDTTRKKLRKDLVDGVRNGEGVAPLSKRIRKIMTGDIGRFRAERIARTEVLRSSNFSRLEGMRQSGVVSAKQWLATVDGRTRADHMTLHNTTQKISDPFVIGSASAQYPGDFGVPEQDIQCRCTTLPVIAAVSYDDAMIKAEWKKFDRRLVPWEKRINRAALRGFADQERDLLKALKNAD